MNSSSESVDQRLMDLEVKASFTDDLVERLNEVIVRQQAQIDRLQREVMDMREQVRAAEPGSFRLVRDEMSPHGAVAPERGPAR